MTDMLCFFFIPVHWLFFAASTYVWVQYVWHTDKGLCAPTMILWVMFVYLEAAIRLRDIKHMPGHLDLCRPFAAHCIGYPVVTLGFGFKSYVGFRMRQRKQQFVAKDNLFYMQLMQQALPVDESSTAEQVDATTSTAVVPAQPILNNNNKLPSSSRQSHEKNGHIPNGAIANGVHNTHNTKSHHRKSVEKCKDVDQHDHNKHSERHTDRQKVNHSHSNGSVVNPAIEDLQQESEPKPTRRREKKEQDKEREAAEYLLRLESDAKKLRSDLHISRASEQELRLQVAALTTSEKVSKGEISSLQRELEDVQQRLQSALSTKSSDKQTMSNLERRIAEERRLRSNVESQLNQERKNRKQEEARAAQVAAQQSTRGECTEACKARRRELESEISDLRNATHWQDERFQALERDNAALAEQMRDMDMLISALSAMQEKNAHLENSLSAENRVKLDLFSALGEAKRQLELRENANRNQEKEIEELKSKIAQVLAVMPNDSFGSPPPSNNISRVRLAESPPSNLDPNATAYTPKGALVASTEA
nr:macoilin-like [Leptinotarsa decemlineata]